MKKHLVFLVATLLAGAANAQVVDNWRNYDNQLVWMNGTNEHCWRDNFWTKETAATEKCGKPAAPMPAPAPVVTAPVVPVVPAPVIAPVVPTPQIVTEKMTYSADALFDFDKASLKAEGQAALNELAAKLKDPAFKLETVVITGHTDSLGTDQYNDRLSTARAQAGKAQLVSQGVNQSIVFAEGKGKRVLKVASATCPKKRTDRIACEAPNRRIDIEVVGVKTITRMVAPTMAPAK